MKKIQWIFVVLFFMVVLIPLVLFNFEKDSISEIDNRMLTEDPLHMEGDLTENVESYVNDRIGFRDEMIFAYTVFNDTVFHKMVHPNYIYGKDGYVFGAGLSVDGSYTEYHEAFVDMVAEIQRYCDERDVPFLFVFNPAKPAVLTEYIPEGVNYDRQWVDQLFAALDGRGVVYVDNTVVLMEKIAAGEVVFNQKYDANHWNDLGAFYGTNVALEEMQKHMPMVHVNKEEDLMIGSELVTTLPVSKFPIHEYVPDICVNVTVNEDMTSFYDSELKRDPVNRAFGYVVNEERMAEGAPKALVFQGSYMNNKGKQYFSNGFGEYIYVHDYQNVIDFSYYFNIFRPECVIFEVAEYTVNDSYFDFDRMQNMDLSPTLAEAEAEVKTRESLPLTDLSVEEGTALTRVFLPKEILTGDAWLLLDGEYDMQVVDGGYEVTVATAVYREYKDTLRICLREGDTLYLYE